MQFFRVPHPPFAGVLCNQSHCVFFYGYTSPRCIQKLLGGLPLNLDRYGDKFLPFSAQNGRTRYRHCHTHGFKTLLFGKDEGELDSWMQKAEGFQIAEINSFLKLIRSDMEAVKNAIKYSYSNGPAEGHNNKIKMIKRQMYGRCKFDLLRLKILC